MLWHSHVEGEKAIEEQSRGAHQESKGSFHTTHQKLITPCDCPCRCVNAKGVLGRPHRCNPAPLSSPRSSPLPPPTPRPLCSPIIMATAAPPPAGAPSSSTGGMWLPSVFQPGVAGQTHLCVPARGDPDWLSSAHPARAPVARGQRRPRACVRAEGGGWAGSRPSNGSWCAQCRGLGPFLSCAVSVCTPATDAVARSLVAVSVSPCWLLPASFPPVRLSRLIVSVLLRIPTAVFCGAPQGAPGHPALPQRLPLLLCSCGRQPATL